MADATYARALRLWLLAAIACDLALIVVRVATYPAFFAQPGAVGYVAEAAVALVIYAAVIAALPALATHVSEAASVLRIGAVVGLCAGAIDMLSTTLESLAALPQPVVTAMTLAAMLALFLLFVVAGFLGARRARRFWPGVVSAICCAVCAVVCVITLGFLLSVTSLPTLARDMLGDPDFVRSGWTDVRAFAIANTFDAAFTHLTEAPLIAGVLGAIGGGIGALTLRGRAFALKK